MVADTIISGLLGLFGTFLVLLATALGFLYKGRRENEGYIEELDSRMQSVERSLRGREDEGDPGHISTTKQEFARLHDRLDDMEDKIDMAEAYQAQSHEKLGEKIDQVIEVLKENDINGHLPEEE